MMLKIYSALMARSEKFLIQLLEKRVSKGKEDASRIHERQGIAELERPRGQLIWLHAASVGEAQSALILVDRLLKANSKHHILVTTGTQTSAQRMQDALPDRAFHQFIPLDHPVWVARFLDHWQPDVAFWMESELWPNLISAVKERNIPSALINGRLSRRSFQRWRLVRNSISSLLSAFDVILAQSEDDAANFQKLGAGNVVASGNLKYSADALAYDENDFNALRLSIGQRPTLLYASTHAGEEEIVASVHSMLKAAHPDLLSIIIPRHPERGEDIHDILGKQSSNVFLRGKDKKLPDDETDIYIANTLGEMGLFYRLAPIAYVGRSLSNDGGGGHNPLEPAQLHCAVLHGQNIQNLADIYSDMQAHNACISVANEDELLQRLEWLLSDKEARESYTLNAYNFANAKAHVIDNVLKYIEPMIEEGQSHAA